MQYNIYYKGVYIIHFGNDDFNIFVSDSDIRKVSMLWPTVR